MDVARILNHYNPELSLSRNYRGNISLVCPFHEDTQASLNMNIEKEIGYCFGCGWKGDIVDFVARIEKVDRLMAMRKISQIANGALNSRPKITAKDVEKSDRQALKEAYYEYRKGYLPDWRMPNYMTGRGLTPELLSEFQVRVDPLSNYPFTIPIRENGKFAGFVRRADDDREPKYMYNKGFRRKLVLMGNYEPGIILVTEGIFDYLKAHQFGQKNCVALMGWKASLEQIEKLKSVTSVIITALDNDDRGKEGTEFLKQFFNVIEFKFPEGVKDLGEIDEELFHFSFKISKEEFNKCLKRKV